MILPNPVPGNCEPPLVTGVRRSCGGKFHAELLRGSDFTAKISKCRYYSLCLVHLAHSVDRAQCRCLNFAHLSMNVLDCQQPRPCGDVDDPFATPGSCGSTAMLVMTMVLRQLKPASLNVILHCGLAWQVLTRGARGGLQAVMKHLNRRRYMNVLFAKRHRFFNAKYHHLIPSIRVFNVPQHRESIAIECFYRRQPGSDRKGIGMSCRGRDQSLMRCAALTANQR